MLGAESPYPPEILFAAQTRGQFVGGFLRIRSQLVCDRVTLGIQHRSDAALKFPRVYRPLTRLVGVRPRIHDENDKTRLHDPEYRRKTRFVLAATLPGMGCDPRSLSRAMKTWGYRPGQGQAWSGPALCKRCHAYLPACSDEIAVANFAGSPSTSLTRRPLLSMSAMAGKRSTPKVRNAAPDVSSASGKPGFIRDS